MTRYEYLAVDLGAESGRVISGYLEQGRIFTQEIHRFPNAPVHLPGGLHWDMQHLFEEVKTGISKAVREGGKPESIGVNSWAVDFGLLDHEGELLSKPYSHRDSRTEGLVEKALERVPAEEIYRRTGIQFIRINSLYQLLAMRGSSVLEATDRLLLIPDLVNYWLTGKITCEFTNATTTQLFNVENGDWDRKLADEMGLPTEIFPEVVPPATGLGTLLPAVRDEVGVREIEVTAVASHDTAAAVVAIPATSGNFAYISSGTWSLVGLETDRPMLTQEALQANFTNEGGFGGKTRFLKNVMGLWLIQECRRSWAEQGKDYSYEELGALAEAAPAFGPLVDPDHPDFLAPGDMPSRIRSFCAATGQKQPEAPGEVARCVFESLALKYRLVVEQAGEIAKRNIEKVHIVGGGSRNRLLCRLTAEATGLPVAAGPVEATALGNLLVQAYARGHLGSLEEIRAVVAASTSIDMYEPSGAGRWIEAAERFSEVLDAAPKLNVSEGG